MIPRLEGWSWETRPGSIITAPPEGKGVGFVRYAERRRPLLRVRDLVKELELDPRFRILDVGKTERMVTDEGEYSALVTVSGLLLEAPVEHTLAFVFLDDCYSVIDGLALRPDQFVRFRAQVRLLALNDMHREGENRRRRFYYLPPPRWMGIARFLQTYWYPHDYPGNPGCLTVIPAIPVPPGSKEFIDSIAEHQMNAGGDFSLEAMGAARAVSTKKKLTGSFWEGVGSAVGSSVRYRDIQVFDDGRFAYPVILDSGRERHAEYLELMRDLVDSIEPVPLKGEVLKGASKQSMDFWAE